MEAILNGILTSMRAIGHAGNGIARLNEVDINRAFPCRDFQEIVSEEIRGVVENGIAPAAASRHPELNHGYNHLHKWDEDRNA
jgi:hypothetical protein